MKGPEHDDDEMDARLMDELIDAMSGRDADSLYPAQGNHGAVVEIHIKPGGMPHAEPDGDEERREGMLPNPDELEEMQRRGMK